MNSSTQRLKWLREYGMLQAQVFALQEKMRVIEEKFGTRPQVDRRGSVGRGRPSPAALKIREWISRQKGDITSGEVIVACGAEQKPTWQILRRLVDEGKLKKLGRGRFRIAA